MFLPSFSRDQDNSNHMWLLAVPLETNEPAPKVSLNAYDANGKLYNVIVSNVGKSPRDSFRRMLLAGMDRYGFILY